MYEESKQLRYEKAAKLRDQIQSIEQTVEKQRINSLTFIDRDVFGYYLTDNDVYIEVMFIRSGNMEDIASYRLSINHTTIEEVFRSFLNQFYSQTRFIPSEVIIPVNSPDAVLLEEWLTERKGKKVSVFCPKRGDKSRLIEMAQKNAMNAYKVSQTQDDNYSRTLQALKDVIGLRNLPERIECFDISNIFGKQAVGSMVTFKCGMPDKSKYKRFRIKTVDQIDDYAMMHEVLLRRYKRAVEEGDLPDLVMVDGGKGQLGVALRVFEELAINDTDLLALSKDRGKSGIPKGEQGEQVHAPHIPHPILLPSSSPVLLFLAKIRDEAHRFAIAYHRKIRDKEYYKSPLDEIPGIGIIRKKALIKRFGSIEGIRNATINQLTEIGKLPAKLANEVYNHFHSAAKT